MFLAAIEQSQHSCLSELILARVKTGQYDTAATGRFPRGRRIASIGSAGASPSHILKPLLLNFNPFSDLNAAERVARLVDILHLGGAERAVVDSHIVGDSVRCPA